MNSSLLAGLRFICSFVVGDDWRLAAGSVAGVATVAALTHFGVNAYWLLPLFAAATLYLSLRRAIRQQRRG